MPIYKLDKKKNGLQGYRVRINYTDAAGNYKQLERTAYGKAEAQDLERRLLADLTEPKEPKTAAITVPELIQKYQEYQQHEVRKTTHAKNQTIFKNYITPYFEGEPIEKLTTARLADWKTQLNQTELSLRTKQNAYSLLRALLNYAVKMDMLLKNPALNVGNFKEVYFEKPAEKLHYYTPEQFTAFITAARSTCTSLLDWGLYTFFCIAYYTGLRKGEINALRWTDLEGTTLHVRRSVAQKVKGEAIVETPPKNKSSYRDIGIPQPLRDLLQEHKQRQQKDKRWDESYRICGGPNCLADTTIAKANLTYTELAKLPHIRIHDFRHSHASLLVNHGINIQEVARRLGHSNVQETWNTYSHLYPKEEERAIEVLNTVLLTSTDNKELSTQNSETASQG